MDEHFTGGAIESWACVVCGAVDVDWFRVDVGTAGVLTFNLSVPLTNFSGPGVFQFNDPEAVMFPQRYYRAVAP